MAVNEVKNAEAIFANDPQRIPAEHWRGDYPHRVSFTKDIRICVLVCIYLHRRAGGKKAMTKFTNFRINGDDCRESGMEQTNNGSAE